MINPFQYITKSSFTIPFLTAVVFILICLIGLVLSSNKPFWIDEYYSLTKSGQGLSYDKIFLGQMSLEGNTSPLFFATQKFLIDLIPYDLSRLKKEMGVAVPYQIPGTSSKIEIRLYKGDPFYYDPFSNAYFRIFSVFFMALAAAVLFSYFSHQYSLRWGAYALLLCLSSWYFWWYGLEARPYIHAFSLTVIQMILFLELLRSRINDQKYWIALFLVNFLLALTTLSALIQIVLMGLCLGIFNREKLKWQRISLAFIVPVGIILYYYSQISLHTYKIKFYFVSQVQNYFISIFTSEIFTVVGLFFIYSLISLNQTGALLLERSFLIRRFKFDHFKEAAVLLLMTILTLVAYMAIVLHLKSTSDSLEQAGIYFTARYLICLVPMGIIAMTVFSRALLNAFEHRMIKTVLISFLVFMLFLRFVYAYKQAHNWIGLQIPLLDILQGYIF